MAGYRRFVMVRSTVSDPSLREDFDHWYRTDHAPKALAIMGGGRAWRMWSKTEPGVHLAVYEAHSRDSSPGFASELGKSMIREYDERWPSGVVRTREEYELVDSQECWAG